MESISKEYQFCVKEHSRYMKSLESNLPANANELVVNLLKLKDQVCGIYDTRTNLCIDKYLLAHIETRTNFNASSLLDECERKRKLLVEIIEKRKLKLITTNNIFDELRKVLERESRKVISDFEQSFESHLPSVNADQFVVNLLALKDQVLRMYDTRTKFNGSLLDECDPKRELLVEIIEKKMFQLITTYKQRTFEELRKVFENESEKVQSDFEKFCQGPTGGKDFQNKFSQLKKAFKEKMMIEFQNMPDKITLSDKVILLEVDEYVNVYLLKADLKRKIQQFDMVLQKMQEEKRKNMQTNSMLVEKKSVDVVSLHPFEEKKMLDANKEDANPQEIEKLRLKEEYELEKRKDMQTNSMEVKKKSIDVVRFHTFEQKMSDANKEENASQEKIKWCCKIASLCRLCFVHKSSADYHVAKSAVIKL